jgi:hypothetical protein
MEQTSKPAVGVTVIDGAAAESGNPPTNPGRLRISRTGSTASALTVYFGLGGTALAGASNDYTLAGEDGAAVNGSAVIGAGKSFVDILVLPFDNATVEADETVVLTLKANAAYTIGAPASGVVAIADNEPVVSIVATDPDASESGTPAADPGMIRIELSTAPAVSPLPVRFTLSGSSAVNPSDYTIVAMNPDGTEGAVVSSPVSIPVGRTFLDLRIKPVDDTLANESDPETVRMQLMSSATNGYKLGPAIIAIVNIHDNE